MARVSGAMITYDDIHDIRDIEGYITDEPVPTGKRALSKEEIQTYLICDISGSYANNQLVPYNRISKKVSPPTIKSFGRSNYGTSTSTAICGDEGSITLTAYHKGVGTVPDVGYTIYTNSGATIIFNGGNQWYYTVYDNAIKVNSSGVVTDMVYCKID